MSESFNPKLRPTEAFKNDLKKTGSILKGTTFRETTLRVGEVEVPMIEVEKADGETFFHPIVTKQE